MSNFAVIGVGGYVAPRHLQAIRDTGHALVAALDRHDSVGILDSYFSDVQFFTEFERFDRHASKLRRLGEEQRIHYVTVCSPNYLHDAHIRFALRIGADCICEKPLVINPWNLDPLAELEQESGCRVRTILQLRQHPTLAALRERIALEPPDRRHDVELTYVTSRGRWYFVSWKGSAEKSGGVATNIGIHFFDLLLWVFGRAAHCEVHLADDRRMAGYLELERARVRWFLSVDRRDLPDEAAARGHRTCRSITVDGQELEFSEGFSDLHTEVYRDILAGGGCGIEDARPSIELVHQIRTHPVALVRDHAHRHVLGEA
jgi:UDP-N-acetyl-2-amino-2-deoxyglucuronate dehydrogenase